MKNLSLFDTNKKTMYLHRFTRKKGAQPNVITLFHFLRLDIIMSKSKLFSDIIIYLINQVDL